MKISFVPQVIKKWCTEGFSSSSTLDKLLGASAKRENITNDHIGIYNDTISNLKEHNLDTREFTKKFAELINSNISINELELFCKSAFFYKRLNQKLDRTTNAFLELTKAKPSIEQFETLKEELDFHIEKMLYIDTLVSCFANLIDSKPNKEQWQAYKETVELFKEKGHELTAITHYYPYLIRGGASYKLLSLYKDIALYYKEKAWDMTNLTNGFIRLANLNPKEELIECIRTAIPVYKKSSLGFDPLTQSLPELIEAGATPKQIKVFSQLVAYYLESGWQVIKFNSEEEIVEEVDANLSASFTNLIKAKPTESQWDVYKKIIRQLKFLKKDVHSFTNNFASLIGKNLDETKWKIINSALSHYFEKKIEAATLVSALNDLFSSKLTPEQVEFYKDAVTKLKELELPLGAFTRGLADIVINSDSTSLCETYRNAFEFHLKKQLEEKGGSQAKTLTNYFKNLAVLEPPLAMLKTYNMGIQNGQIKTSQESINFLRDLVVHSSIFNLIRSDNEEDKKRIRNFISEFVKNDPVPYPQKDLDGNVHPDAKKVTNETLNVFRRSFDGYHGFSSLTFETKRPPSKDPPLLARFGNDVAQNVQYINARDINLFPGRGIIISKIIPEKIFVSDNSNKKDPYHKYKENWPWAKEIFDDLPKTHFIFTRGFIAVNCFNPKYELKDANGKKVHFSYLFLNDHHHNYKQDVAYLVPTHILRKKLTGTLISYKDYLGPSSNYKDINEAGLTIKDLEKEAKELGINIINLCWGSNIGGGLCNAYPLNSSPFHEWEDALRKKGETVDIYGRVHKSHITGDYLTYMAPKMNKLLEPLREAHNQVFRAANNYQNLFDLFRLSLAMWHKGETLGSPLDLPMPEEDLFDWQASLANEQYLTRGDKDDMDLNPNSLRMLVQAYKWHEGKEYGLTNKNDFPILVVADALDHSTKPTSPIFLDTFDMTLRTKEKEIQLPEDSNGAGIDEALIWFREVMPYVKHSLKDLRFYDRRDLGLT